MNSLKKKSSGKSTQVPTIKKQDAIVLSDKNEPEAIYVSPRERWGNLRHQMDCQDVSKMP